MKYVFIFGGSLSVADPGFSRGGGREPSRGGVNTPNFPENCMKSKEFGRPGGGVRPSRPPRSANGYSHLSGCFWLFAGTYERLCYSILNAASVT